MNDKTINWRRWKSKRDDPQPGRFILVRRVAFNDILYAYAIGTYSFHVTRYMALSAQERGPMLNSYIMDMYFSKGDEWIYADDLKKKDV